jgi:salicylate hydroxylase
MFDRNPIDNWTSGRITLLGDAAHPMLQYLAQGACQAIEDADCLAQYMLKHDGDVHEAFASYQQDRLPRTAQVQRLARAWGEIWHARDSIVPALRNRVFARSSEDHYEDLDWLYQAKMLQP